MRDDNGKLTYINYMNKEFFDTVPYLPDTSNPYETAIAADITDQKLMVTPDREICVTSKITIEGTKEDGTETKTGIYLNTIVKKDK